MGKETRKEVVVLAATPLAAELTRGRRRRSKGDAHEELDLRWACPFHGDRQQRYLAAGDRVLKPPRMALSGRKPPTSPSRHPYDLISRLDARNGGRPRPA